MASYATTMLRATPIGLRMLGSGSALVRFGAGATIGSASEVAAGILSRQVSTYVTTRDEQKSYEEAFNVQNIMFDATLGALSEGINAVKYGATEVTKLNDLDNVDDGIAAKANVVCDVNEGGLNSIDYIHLSNDLGKKIKADDYKLIDIEEALIANEDWADMGYNLPPVAEGTKAYNVEAGNFQYARVFKEGVNKPKSPFLLRADDIRGLTAEQIAQKYALPQIPDKVVYPNIPTNTPLEVSIVGPQESWGTLGGDVQYAIKDVLLDDSWFTDIHDLK